MDEAGLVYTPGKTLFNSRMAQEFAAWAVTQRDGQSIHARLYEAVFVEARNIGLIPVLRDIAGEAGLDAEAALTSLKRREYKPRVEADWEAAWTSGVTGVPNIVLGDIQLLGCQAWPQLERFALHAGARRRELNPTDKV